MLDLTPAPVVIEDTTFPLYGESVHRLTAQYCGHIVQVIQHDENLFLTVGIDGKYQQVHMDDLDSHVANVIGGA